jgi:hypothetical protein
LGINGGPSILDGRPQDSRFNNGRGSGRSASNNERSHHQRDDSGDSGVSSSNPSYQQSRNQRNYEPRDSQGSGASNGNSDQPPTSGTQGGGASNGNSDQPPTSGTQGDKDVPTESMRGYPSMEAYESGHPGRALRERLIDDPLTGHNRRSSAGKGDDLGARDLPRGAPDKRSARNQMDVRQDPARSPLPGSQGPDDSEQPRFPGSDNNRARATRGDNDLGNDLPLRSQNMGGPSVAPFAESLWWQRNGPRAQPPK